MRLGSISLLLLVGIVGVGCGGGGSGSGADGTMSGKGTTITNDSYQTPPSTFQPPTAINPTTYEPPPGTYETPPGQTNAGGIGTGVPLSAVCDRLCQEVLALNCDFSSTTDNSGQNAVPASNSNGKANGNASSGDTSSSASAMATPEACAQACDQLEQSVPCPDEYAAAFSCILDNVTLTCALFTDATTQMTVDQSLAVTCRAPLVAFAACVGGSQSNPTPQPTERCMPDTCLNCQGACETCLCQNYGDTSLCPICANQ